MNLSFVSDNKNFWKVVKPLLTVKGCVVGNNTVISEKKNTFINDDKKVSKTLNSYFDNIVTTLDIRENIYITKKVLTWN